MDNPVRVLSAITKLLSPFPAGNTQGSADEVLRRYVEAVEEFTSDDIEAGVDRLMKGKVPGYDGRFAPTPPQLATAARRSRDERLDHEALVRRYQPRLPAPDIVHTPEERERAKALVADFVASVAAADIQQTTEEQKRRKERWEKVNARFQPPLDDASVMGRLVGYSTGSPESDEFAA